MLMFTFINSIFLFSCLPFEFLLGSKYFVQHRVWFSSSRSTALRNMYLSFLDNFWAVPFLPHRLHKLVSARLHVQDLAMFVCLPFCWSVTYYFLWLVVRINFKNVGIATLCACIYWDHIVLGLTEILQKEDDSFFCAKWPCRDLIKGLN